MPRIAPTVVETAGSFSFFDRSRMEFPSLYPSSMVPANKMIVAMKRIQMGIESILIPIICLINYSLILPVKKTSSYLKIYAFIL
jgi:hypothetical protein